MAASWLLLAVMPAQAAFTSLYAFGDGVCTTTNNTSGPAYLYYGRRYTNGRVWLEVLAQRQGIAYDANKNWSYFGHYSAALLSNLTKFTVPSDANTALFAVWVCDADFVWNVEHYGTDLATWNNAINQSLTNHFKAITNLYYGKGARTLIMPNAVDISTAPFYSGLPVTDRNFIRQRTIEFNTAFAGLLNQARTTLTNLTIYSPDFFALDTDLLAHAGAYGLTNAGIDAVDDPKLADKSLAGPGATYVFWDYLDPSAKAHMVMADLVQQMMSPVSITRLTVQAASNRLDIANVPIARDGVVLVSTNLSNWTPLQSFGSTNLFQSILIPTMPPPQYYRLNFPFAWSWP